MSVHANCSSSMIHPCLSNKHALWSTESSESLSVIDEKTIRRIGNGIAVLCSKECLFDRQILGIELQEVHRHSLHEIWPSPLREYLNQREFRCRLEKHYDKRYTSGRMSNLRLNTARHRLLGNDPIELNQPDTSRKIRDGFQWYSYRHLLAKCIEPWQRS